jgi:hypothetical protein
MEGGHIDHRGLSGVSRLAVGGRRTGPGGGGDSAVATLAAVSAVATVGAATTESARATACGDPNAEKQPNGSRRW